MDEVLEEFFKSGGNKYQLSDNEYMDILAKDPDDSTGAAKRIMKRFAKKAG